MWIVGWFGDVDLDIVELGYLLQCPCLSKRSPPGTVLVDLTPVGCSPAAAFSQPCSLSRQAWDWEVYGWDDRSCSAPNHGSDMLYPLLRVVNSSRQCSRHLDLASSLQQCRWSPERRSRALWSLVLRLPCLRCRCRVVKVNVFVRLPYQQESPRCWVTSSLE